jgi:hypothetical protein
MHVGLGWKVPASTSCPREEDLCRYGIDEGSRAGWTVLGLHKLSEREGFMQTHCHGQSVTKLCQDPTASAEAQAGGRAGRIHADTLPWPVRTFDDSQQIERNSVPIRVSAMDSNLLTQWVNRDDGIMVEGMLTQHLLSCLVLMQVESLTEICKSSDNGNEDIDDSEFPSVPEVISNYWKDQRAKRGLSRGCTSEACDKSTLDEGGYSINPDKSISGLNSGDSQGGCANSSSWISSLTMHR